MIDGIIKVDSERGKIFGLTSDKFLDSTYLWKKGKYIWISLIAIRNRNKGHTQKLFKTILEKDFPIKVSTPLGIMPYILRKMGFKRTIEYFGEPMNESGEVWVRETEVSSTK